nr:unnamed protein product [Digitaria exilis]
MPERRLPTTTPAVAGSRRHSRRLRRRCHLILLPAFAFALLCLAYLSFSSHANLPFHGVDLVNNLFADVPEGSFIVRAHTPMSNLFSCLWFNEVNRFTSRDQLSFAYTYLKFRRTNPAKPFLLNMFKDCERRAIAKLFHHRTNDTTDPPPANLRVD